MSEQPESTGTELPDDDAISLTAREFADVYEVDTDRAITEAKLQRWREAMEAQNAS